MAERVVNHPLNRRYLSLIGRDPDTVSRGLNVGVLLGSQIRKRWVLATIGHNADIVIPNDDHISEIHFSFELNEHSAQVMLFDRSSNRSTNVYGPDAHDFSKEQKVRKVLVAPDLNTNIWISVDNSEVGKGKGYGFALHWHDPVFSMKKELELIPEDSLHRRTIDATSPDHGPLPPDTLPDLRPKMRLKRIRCLGTGNSGAVMQAANVDTGDVYAVKVVHNSDRPERTLREAKTLTEISHVRLLQWNILKTAS